MFTCAAICLYAELALSFANNGIILDGSRRSQIVDEQIVTHSKYNAMGRHIGSVVLGAQHKSGLFAEAGHFSGIDKGNDRGWEELKIGVRWHFDL